MRRECEAARRHRRRFRVIPMLVSERRNAIHLLTLNRPEKRNALHPDLISELSRRFTEVEGDPGIRVVIITGNGSTFCSGLDLIHLLNLDANGRIEYLRGFFSLFSQFWCLKQ